MHLLTRCGSVRGREEDGKGHDGKEKDILTHNIVCMCPSSSPSGRIDATCYWAFPPNLFCAPLLFFGCLNRYLHHSGRLSTFSVARPPWGYKMLLVTIFLLLSLSFTPSPLLCILSLAPLYRISFLFCFQILASSRCCLPESQYGSKCALVILFFCLLCVTEQGESMYLVITPATHSPSFPFFFMKLLLPFRSLSIS
uniref:WGS project CAEQ00000000 data, annotated contig 768 n=1 Tax=Trypanosoma congolense (strain IL3000) TaxID=1068625 RepID=F9WIC8_TRYCI|nr:unnamed protein product [Trypanosoma congolense IL3000]